MAQDYQHEPVMVEEVVEAIAPVPPGAVVDATVGGGGHAAAILDAHSHLRVIGIDRDPNAVAAARARLAVSDREHRFIMRDSTSSSRLPGKKASLRDSCLACCSTWA